MMHVQGEVNIPVLVQTLARLQEIEASQKPIEAKRWQADGQLSALEGVLIGDIIAMLPDEQQQKVFECYNICLRLL